MKSWIALFYYLFIKTIGTLLFWVKPGKEVTLLVSFPDNARAILKEYQKGHYSFPIHVLLTQHAKSLEKEFPSLTASVINEKHPLHICKAVFSMLSSKAVIVDNYFVLTTVLASRPEIECIQVWHANGAFKRFGLKDVNTQNRSRADVSRFRKVYASFDRIVVGSEHMAGIFKEFFDIKGDPFLRFGVPLTDAYYEARENRIDLKNKYHLPADQKIMLYAPTFRDHQFESFSLPFSEKQLEHDLKGEYVLAVKLHPVMKHSAELPEDSAWIKDVSDLPLADLLKMGDLLISDYSSVPFEFALLDKPILFYAYDMEAYNRTRGLIRNYKEVIPGVPCRDSKMLLDQLKDMDKLQSEVERFSREWNRYSKGNASKQLLSYINEKLS
ncbi:CDP-glycerol glycerophosphotransferase family protein [Bacillus vallismortis]|uniref:CDP-glycerol glycerophosphotransferase family protein n=1 Tax=Bacillus vallismortis TaxID=72361 RepID=UPI00227D9982|nr:CDP-glycerol glycerophosphotransferase family protein [Bacillus vallismortis]MCI3984824.1 CDP-glycerol glycerophosphotransferase family protein [Bacillus vallismortis]MCY8533816.1 CDP-glycerol glycerophosphotransferase family protein [Bacillus vallismortis]MCY8546151.1 CDP-glycerol glycerophosphotransferase family protein [Bacillus vallismortis]